MISADSLYAREEIVLCVYTVPYNPGSGAGAGNEGFNPNIYCRSNLLFNIAEALLL